eukprot:1971179-Heterocapsa_arctica.AAC.1
MKEASLRKHMNDVMNMRYRLASPGVRSIILGGKSRISGGSITHPQISQITIIPLENLANGQVLSGMESRGPDNWPGKEQLKAGQMMMELKKLLMNSPPG